MLIPYKDVVVLLEWVQDEVSINIKPDLYICEAGNLGPSRLCFYNVLSSLHHLSILTFEDDVESQIILHTHALMSPRTSFTTTP